MDGTVISSAATQVLTDITLAAISLLAAYALHYIRVGIDKLRAQTAKLDDERERKLLARRCNDALFRQPRDDV